METRKDNGMVHPREMAWLFTKPCLLVVGGLAFLTAIVAMLLGDNPVGPVGHFLSGSIEALWPVLGRLIALWLFYCVVYTLVGDQIRDLWAVARGPDRLPSVLRRRGFKFLPRLAYLTSFAPLLSWVRHFRLYLSIWLATGWRAGDSVQRE